jgi:hypothetical protein
MSWMLIEYTQEAGAGKVNFVQDLAKRHLFIGETKTSRKIGMIIWWKIEYLIKDKTSLVRLIVFRLFASWQPVKRNSVTKQR